MGSILAWFKTAWAFLNGDALKSIIGIWDRLADLFATIGSWFEKTEQEKRDETRKDVEKAIDDLRRTGRPPRTK